jgi:hypothetical protein
MKKNLLKSERTVIGWAAVLFLFLLNSCGDSNVDEVDPCKNGPFLNVDNTIASIEGEANGEVTVSASSGKAPYMYSIDGTNFQSSGSFTDLEGDVYTVTVKDANNCTSSSVTSVNEVQEVSYTSQIRPLIDTNCQLPTCHGDQSGIPSWATYSVVKANASLIKTKTSNKEMPPTGPLSDEEIGLISDWVDRGAPNN